MKKYLLALSLFISVLAVSSPARAEYGYFGLEPDIVTNYISGNNRKLGYVRVTVELMIEDISDLETVEHHAPLLRAEIIEIFGRQVEKEVKSLKGRERIKELALRRCREVLKQETGSELLKDMYFTKYLYQG